MHNSDQMRAVDEQLLKSGEHQPFDPPEADGASFPPLSPADCHGRMARAATGWSNGEH